MAGKSERVTVDTYFSGPETLRPSELVWGVVRESPAPHPGHQTIVLTLASRLREDVRRSQAGRIYLSPIDVVLDERRGLVVQPDIAFVSAPRASIVTDRIRGAPDLVIEVLSWATARRDRTRKLGWYSRYGVRECWMVDQFTRTIDVIACSKTGRRRQTFSMGQRLRSGVLSPRGLTVAEVFENSTG